MSIEDIKERLYSEGEELDDVFIMEIFSLLDEELKKGKFRSALEKKRLLLKIKEQKTAVMKLKHQYTLIRKEITNGKEELNALNTNINKESADLEKWQKENEAIIQAFKDGSDKQLILDKIKNVEKLLKQATNNLKIVDGRIVDLINLAENKIPSDVQT